MKTVCFYFQIHQPNRLLNYDFFRIGENSFYENDELNAEVLRKVAGKCYLPAAKMLKDLIEETQGAFQCAFSISGVFLEQCEHHAPEVITAFQELVATGCVELLAETYYHSLSSAYSIKEFRRQVTRHTEQIQRLFGVQPQIFRNTELVYSNDIALEAESMGFKGILAEGHPGFLNDRTPNVMYRAPGTKSIQTLLRNAELSDDLGFRFADKNWDLYPLTPEVFLSKIQKEEGDHVGIFLDFESIGEHQWENTGIFDFYRDFIRHAVVGKMHFVTPSALICAKKELPLYDCHTITSWADAERDLSAWQGNVMQQEALKKLVSLEDRVKTIGDPDLLHVWAKLQTSDHFYYMATKSGLDQGVHEYFSPYDSAYDAYIFFMNALSDLNVRLTRIEGN